MSTSSMQETSQHDEFMDNQDVDDGDDYDEDIEGFNFSEISVEDCVGFMKGLKNFPVRFLSSLFTFMLHFLLV